MASVGITEIVVIVSVLVLAVVGIFANDQGTAVIGRVAGRALVLVAGASAVVVALWMLSPWLLLLAAGVAVLWVTLP